MFLSRLSQNLYTFATMKAMIFTSMPMFVCLFWSITLLLGLLLERFDRSKAYLLVFMLAATLLYWGHCVFFNHVTWLMPVADTIYATCNLAVFPLFYLYICKLTLRTPHQRPQWLTLLPTVAGGLTIGCFYLLMNDSEQQQFISIYLYGGSHNGLVGYAAKQAYVHDVCKALFALQVVPVFFLGRHHLQEFDTIVRNAYADTERKTLGPLHWLLMIFAVCSLFSFIANLIGRQTFSDSYWLLAIPSLLFSSVLFVLGYLGYRLQFTIADIEHDEQLADIPQPKQEEVSDLRLRIEQIMQSEKLFLQPNLKIVDLVQRLGSNRNYVYQAINREMGLSFSEYVNKLRIKYAAELLAQRPELKLSEIAEQSGFTSSTSFYRNFKLFCGMGPKEYQNKLKGNAQILPYQENSVTLPLL